MTDRHQLGYRRHPAVRWRGRVAPLIWTAVVLVALTALTAVLIERPFGFGTYAVSLGALLLVWLLAVVFVVGRPPEDDATVESGRADRDG